MDRRLEELLQKCNARWSDDFVDDKRHIRGNFTNEEKEEILNLYNKSRILHSPIQHLPEIVFDE